MLLTCIFRYCDSKWVGNRLYGRRKLVAVDFVAGRVERFPRHENDPDPKSFARILGNFWPVFALILAYQASALVQKAFVSGLSTGSIASLNYAAKLEGLPVGIFSVAITTVYFPVLV